MAFAQSSATLAGIVSDASGAVVPKASVTLRNELSGDIRHTVTNSEGAYTFPSLQAATYELTVGLPGFKEWKTTGIVLHSSDNRSVQVTLEVQSGSEHVEVVSTADVITIDSGEKSSTLTSKDIQNLAIVGRDAAELLKILPGAALTANGGKNGAAYTGEVYGINGSGIGGNQGGLGGTNINGQAVDITMDGGHTYDPGAVGSATPVNPNVEMIQEVKVLSSNFDAENTKGPVVMNTVSKAGGNQFHGEGYLVARNAVLNSADWQDNYDKVAKPDSHYFFPGGNIGGPVLLPFTNFNRHHDKLFFFEGFEYYDQLIDGGVDRAFVPTAQERNGDFTDLKGMNIPFWGLGTVPNAIDLTAHPLYTNWANAVKNGVIQPQFIDPGAKILLNTYPLPNTDPATNNGYNFKQALLTQQNSWQSLSRVDYNFSDNTKVFIRYNAEREVQNSPNGLWQGGGADQTIPDPSNIVSNNRSDSFAGSLTHTFSATMTSETNIDYTYIDFPNQPQNPAKIQRAQTGFPYKGIYGTAQTDPTLQSWGGAFPTLGVTGYNFHPKMLATKGIFSAAENFAKVWGAHTVKLGGYYEQLYNDQDNWGENEGMFEYEPWNSLTGNLYADMLMGIGFSGYTEASQPPLSNIGEKILDLYAQDTWQVNRKLTLHYGMRFEHLPQPYDKGGIGLAVFDPSQYSNDPSQLNNHTGLLWHAIDHNIPLSGGRSPFLFFSPRFGLAYDLFGNGRTVLRGGWGQFRDPASPQNNNYTGAWGTAVGSKSYSCYFQEANCLTWASIDGLAQNSNIPQGPSSGYTSISVVGNAGNAVEQPLTTSYSFSIDQRLPARFLLEASYVGNQSKYLPEQVDINAVPLFAPGGASAADADTLRPRRNYQAINEGLYIGKSEYDSAQLSLQRNVGWLNIMANYTFSKSMGTQGVNGALPDYGLHYYWGVNTGNRPQVFQVAYTITVPDFYHGNGFVKQVANGWQISGISLVESGPDLTAQSANFHFQGLNSQTALGSPQAPGNPLLTCNPTSNLAKNQYVNGNCFEETPAGVLGAGVYPYIPGPAFFENDMTATKNFRITERQKLQLRLAAFNVFNHPLVTFDSNDQNLFLKFNGPGTPQANSTFGIAQYKEGHRLLELAIKYQF